MSFHVVVVPIGSVDINGDAPIEECPTSGFINTMLTHQWAQMPAPEDLVDMFGFFAEKIEAWRQDYWKAVIEAVGDDCVMTLQHFEAFVFEQNAYDMAINLGGKFDQEAGVMREYVYTDSSDPNRLDKLFIREESVGTTYTPWGPTQLEPAAHFRFDGTTAFEVSVVHS